jgi:hypothetical protein
MAPAPQGNFAAGAQLPMVQIEAARKAKIVMLPSGLGIVSAATARNRMLAVDQAGALFLSEDSGKHWDSVARQWVGRVVAVRLQQALNGNATEAGSEGAQQESGVVADVAITPIPPAAVFEIVNEKDLIWTSTDGKNWKAK